MANMVNAMHICIPKDEGTQTWHLPCLPSNYLSVFTYLRHTCKEQICANPHSKEDEGN